MSRELYAKFRLSVDNGFRNEYSYVDYRKYGEMEVWTGNRVSGAKPKSHTGVIEVWFNWNLVGIHKSYQDAKKQILELLATTPASLQGLEHYLNISP